MKKAIKKTGCLIITVALLLSSFVPLPVTANSTVPYENGVYEISTVADFNAFREVVVKNSIDFTGKTVVLMNSLDLNHQTVSNIGNNYGAFNGTFDGQGHTIKNFTDSGHYLFPNIDSNGVIENLMVDADISLQDKSLDSDFDPTNYGIIAYDLDGSIQNVEVNGSLIINTDSFIAAGSANAKFSAFVGCASKSASIRNCICNVDIISSGSKTSYDNYAKTSIFEYAPFTQGDTIYSNCYYVGQMNVFTTNDYPEICMADGSADDPVTYDNVKNPHIYSGCEKSSNIVPKTTAELRQQSTYKGFDFNGIWAINSSENDGIPYLDVKKQTIALEVAPAIADKTYDGNLNAQVTGFRFANLTDEQKTLISQYNVKIADGYTIKSAKFADREGNVPVNVTADNLSLGYTPNQKYDFTISKVYDTVNANLKDNGAPSPDTTKQMKLLNQSKTAIKLCLDELYGDGKDPGGYGNEWPILTMARCGYPVRPGYYDEWFKNLQKDITAMINGTYDPGDGSKYSIDKLEVTDYERMVLAITAIGYDPADIKGIDLIAKISSKDTITSQLSMAKTFALIALDSYNYKMPIGNAYTTRAELVKDQIDYANSVQPDGLIDYTSMNLQSLAPYYNPNAKHGDSGYTVKQL